MPQIQIENIYGLYARKSSESEDRQVNSIPSQKTEFEKIAKDLGLKIAVTLAESHSAKYPEKRPVFAQMIKMIERGEINSIMTWNPNRLSRNSVDTGKLIYLMDQGKLLEVRTPNQVFRNNPNDKFLLSLFCGQAKLENDNKGEDVKKGFRSRLAAGHPIGLVPEGYKNSQYRKKGANEALVDAERFPLVRRMWDLILTGNYNPQQILDIANNEWGYRTIQRTNSGGRPLSRSAIYRLFNNPFYFGKREYPKGSKTLIPCAHKPMITETEFYRVQEILGNKRMWQAPHNKEFAFTGMIRCGECQSSITAEEKHRIICTKCKHKFSYIHRTNCPKCETSIAQMDNVKKLDYIYYHCTKRKNKNCTQGSVRLEDLEKQITEFLSSIHIKQQYVDWAIKYLQEEHADESNLRQAVQISQQSAYNLVCNRLDKLLEMRLRDEITEAEYLAKKAALLEEKERLQGFLQGTNDRQNTALQQTEEVFTFAQKARLEFETASLQRKREVLNTVCSKLTLCEGKLGISAYEPFKIIQESASQLPEIKELLETHETPINKKPTRSFDEVGSLWLGSWDSNPGPIGYT